MNPFYEPIILPDGEVIIPNVPGIDENDTPRKEERPSRRAPGQNPHNPTYVPPAKEKPRPERQMSDDLTSRLYNI